MAMFFKQIRLLIDKGVSYFERKRNIVPFFIHILKPITIKYDRFYETSYENSETDAGTIDQSMAR